MSWIFLGLTWQTWTWRSLDNKENNFSNSSFFYDLVESNSVVLLYNQVSNANATSKMLKKSMICYKQKQSIQFYQ